MNWIYVLVIKEKTNKVVKFIISLWLFQFTEIIFEDHQTGNKIYFESRNNQAIKASLNYGRSAHTYGLGDGVGGGRGEGGGWSGLFLPASDLWWSSLQGLPGFCPHRELFHDMHQLVLRC